MITTLLLATTMLFSNPTSDEPTTNTPTEEVAQPTTITFEKASFNYIYKKDFSQWVNERLVYPEQARENYIKGCVYVTFTIDEYGRVKNVKIDEGICDELNQEAIRVISLSPKWNPAKLNGKPVETHYRMGINFELA